jgi:hypothetical protein
MPRREKVVSRRTCPDRWWRSAGRRFSNSGTRRKARRARFNKRGPAFVVPNACTLLASPTPGPVVHVAPYRALVARRPAATKVSPILERQQGPTSWAVLHQRCCATAASAEPSGGDVDSIIARESPSWLPCPVSATRALRSGSRQAPPTVCPTSLTGSQVRWACLRACIKLTVSSHQAHGRETRAEHRHCIQTQPFAGGSLFSALERRCSAGAAKPVASRPRHVPASG